MPVIVAIFKGLESIDGYWIGPVYKDALSMMGGAEGAEGTEAADGVWIWFWVCGASEGPQPLRELLVLGLSV